jgi:hypothetical protein
MTDACSSAYQLPLNREKHVAVERAVLGRAGVHGACTRQKEDGARAKLPREAAFDRTNINLYGRRLTRST